jgi:hypothetical protein
MEPVDLQKWAIENEPSKEMYYYEGYWDQIIFIRNIITYLIFDTSDEAERSRSVVSTHVSKSIKLPVYQFEAKKLGLTLTLRYNFSDWKVSVSSHIPITCDFMSLFDGSQEWSTHYCEGFGADRIYKSFNENNKEFTVELDNKFKLYTFIVVLTHFLKSSLTIKI